MLSDSDTPYSTYRLVEVSDLPLAQSPGPAQYSDPHSIASDSVFERNLHSDLIDVPKAKPDDYVSAEAAAVYLGVSAKTLANARVTGKSPVYTKAFGRIRYQVRDLMDYMAARRRRSTSETGASE